jgi:hypothetical protein
MLSAIAGIALVIAVAILVGAVAYGIFGYTEDRALGIRAGELEDQTNLVVEEVRHLRIGKPDLIPTARLDRHWAYQCVLAAIWCYGWGIFLAPPTGNLASADELQQKLLAGTFLVGSSLTMIGSALGLKVGRWIIARGIADNIVSPRLCDDVRIPYAFACSGWIMTALGMAVYAATAMPRTLATLGGWFSVFTVVMAVGLIPQFYFRIGKYLRAKTVVIAEALAEIEREANGEQ